MVVPMDKNATPFLLFEKLVEDAVRLDAQRMAEESKVPAETVDFIRNYARMAM